MNQPLVRRVATGSFLVLAQLLRLVLVIGWWWQNPHRGHEEHRSNPVLGISKSYNTLMSLCAHSVYVCNWYHPYAGHDSSIVIIHNPGVL